MKNLDLKLNEENIYYVLKNNFINRNKYLSSIFKLINGIEENKIIALDGEWGSGKTWFVKSIEYLMNSDANNELKIVNNEIMDNVKDNYMIFYYNAWENDDAENAMLSLIYKLINDSCLQKHENEVGAIPRLLNTIIKFATNGSVDIKQDVFGEQWNNKQITDCIETSEEIKKTFKELINNLLIENKNKILIIIDEIDRCKPVFAIDLLESIKHFYDDDRIIFLVTTNNKELASSVCKVYGEKYDGDLYLDRFFDINLELPNNYIQDYINAIDEGNSGSNFHFKAYRELAKENKLTMREYNRYLSSMESIKNNLIEEYSYLSLFANYIIVPISMCLRIKDKNRYYNFIKGEEFSIIKQLVDNNQFYHKLGRKILSQKDNSIITNIHSKHISEKEKIILENQEILKNLEEIYNQLLGSINPEEDEWEYKEILKETLDIISLFN
ncbi:MAG: hypothetical protein IJ223_03500 [Clostridia bacterium]|nr:hypothetical protein [Clostridia bacterium]